MMNVIINNKDQRIIWIDVLKGIAIFFVVLGHNPFLSKLSPKVFNIIFSFHMPLFLFIAGYLFNPIVTGWTITKKRFKSLLKPYIFTMAIIILVYTIFKHDHSIGWYSFWAFYGNGPNLPKLALHLWFLPHLFLVTLFVWFCYQYFPALKKSLIVQMITMIILLISGFLFIGIFWTVTIPASVANFNFNQFLIGGLLDNPAYSKIQLQDTKEFIFMGLPWGMDIMLVSAAFFLSGYLVHKYMVADLFCKHSIAWLALLLFALLHFFYNYTIDLNLRRYDNFIICTVLAFAGIYFCIYLSNVIANADNRISHTIQYVGHYSLIVYIFHQIAQSKVYFGIISLTPNNPSIAFLPALAAGIGLPILLNYLLLERFKFFRFWYYSR